MKKVLFKAIRLLEEEIDLLEKWAKDSEFAGGSNYRDEFCEEKKRARKLRRAVNELKKAL